MPATDLFRQRIEQIRDSKLSIRKKWAMFVIADHAGLSADGGGCFASIETLSDELSLSASQTNALLKELIDDGLVIRQRARYRPSTLTIDWVKLSELRKSRTLENQKSGKPELRKPGVRTPETRSQNSGNPELSPYKEHPVNTHRNTQGRDGRSATVAEQAEQIYQAYPRKAGKKAALKAIAKALQECPFNELLAAVKDFAAAVEGTPDPSMIKHPATWFNAGCWQDDRSEWALIGRDRTKTSAGEKNKAAFDAVFGPRGSTEPLGGLMAVAESINQTQPSVPALDDVSRNGHA